MVNGRPSPGARKCGYYQPSYGYSPLDQDQPAYFMQEVMQRWLTALRFLAAAAFGTDQKHKTRSRLRNHD